MTAKRCVLKVPPKTFRLDSWITELDHATNLVGYFQTVGPATWKARVPKMLQRNSEYSVFDRQSRG